MAEDNLLDVFWPFSRQVRQAIRQGLAPLGVTPSQSRALGVLRRHGPLRLGELSERLRIAPRSATEIVDELQERGWCARTPDPADRRATAVELTDAGRELAKAIRQAQLEQAERYFSVLDAGERAALGAILGKLTRGEG